MVRKGLFGAALLACVAPSSLAFGCADVGCEVQWKLSGDDSCADLAVLNPGNDTRVNLALLLRELSGKGMQGLTRPAPDWDSEPFGRTFINWQVLRGSLAPIASETSEQSDFSGSRCASLRAGDGAFAAAMSAERGLTPSERTSLGAARLRLQMVCQGGSDLVATDGSARPAPLPDWPAGITSAPGKAFLAYLQASEAFYGERWDEARRGFAALAQPAQANGWLRETSTYMLGRVELGAALTGTMDESGYFIGPSKADRAAAARGKAAVGAYLRGWPAGRYAASAKGLARRALWLGGEHDALAAAYESLLASSPGTGKDAADLVQEVDSKLLFTPEAKAALIDGPILLAAIDLLRMRAGEAEYASVWAAKPLTAQELAAQQPRFASVPALFAFLQASHAFYIAKDYRRVLALLPDRARQARPSPLAFSAQVLRGQALAALKDRNESGFWQQLIGVGDPDWQRSIAELGLALNLERSGRLAAVFAPDSAIAETNIRRELLIHSAGPALLRQVATDATRPQAERDLALFTLLNKQLSHGDYAGFLANRPLAHSGRPPSGEGITYAPAVFVDTPADEGGYRCAPLATSLQALIRNPRDNPARLCLGEFWRLSGLDGIEDTPPAADELGGFAHEFPGRNLPRGEIYAAVIADAAAAPSDKAYALYRAVNCYAPSGFNSCGGAEVPQSQRRAWFNQLKRSYPQSPWAQRLRYFW